MKYLVFLFIAAFITPSFADEKTFQLQVGINKFTVTLINTGEVALTNLYFQLSDATRSDELILGNHFLPKLVIGEQINIALEIYLKEVPRWDSKVIQLNILSNNVLIRSKSIKLSSEQIFDYKLEQNFPNPFNSQTTIKFTLPEGAEKSPTTLDIYDINGSKIITLLNEKRDAGYYSINWYGKNTSGIQVASGIYFYTLTNGNLILVKKLQIVK